MIHAQAGSDAYFQFVVFLSQQVVQFYWYSCTFDVLVHQPGIVAISKANADTVSQS